MENFRKYLITSLFLCFALGANAATKGCLELATGRMYYQTPTPASSNTYFLGSAFYTDEANCTDQYYTVASTSSSNCYAYYKGTGKKNKASSYYITGKKRTFNLLNCPIDDYILPLLLVVGTVGCFYLRRLEFIR